MLGCLYLCVHGYCPVDRTDIYKVYMVNNLILRELLHHRTKTSGINLSHIGLTHKQQPDSFQSEPRFLFVVSQLQYFLAQYVNVAGW